MKIFTFIFLQILFSCGKKDPQSIVLPGNQASEKEAEIIGAVVEKIQKDFDELGVNVNLRSIPFHVTTLDPKIAGICVYRSNGSPVGIAVNHSVLKNWEVETPEHYGLIYRVLLHEIGHCFFRRQHEDDELFIPGLDTIEISVMKDYGRANTLKELWPYYVREVAGLDRLQSAEDLKRYLDLTPL